MSSNLCNVGRWDRIFRVLVGLVLLFLVLTDRIGAWGWLGILPLLTGLFRFCPLYRLLGMSSSCGNKDKPSQ